MLVFWLIIAAYKLFFSSKIVVASNRSGSGSNQPKPLSIEFADTKDQSAINAKAKPKAPQNAKKKTNIPMQPLDSPAMGTRRKKMAPASPAMSTRSKRRLSLWWISCICSPSMMYVWTTLFVLCLCSNLDVCVNWNACVNLIYLGSKYICHDVSINLCMCDIIVPLAFVMRMNLKILSTCTCTLSFKMFIKGTRKV